MPDEASKEIGKFLDYIYEGFSNVYVYLATIEGGDHKTFEQRMAPWPTARKGLVSLILSENAKGKDVYYCPSPFRPNEEGKASQPTRENAVGSRVLYVDFDKQSAPKDWDEVSERHNIPKPTVRVESSVPGNEHDYWLLPEIKDPDWVEEKNRALASRLGADMSGWDINQLLRVPHTYNQGHAKKGERKDWYEGEARLVTVKEISDAPVDFEHFESLKAEKEAFSKITLSSDLPTAQDALALGNTSSQILEQFNMNKEEASESSPEKRSGALMKLAYMLAEVGGYSDDQMYAIIEDADRRWEKYVKRSAAGREKILLDTIARARAKHGYISADDVEFSGLLKNAAVTDASNLKLVYSAQEFLDTEIHIEWIMRKQIAKNSMGIITGQPGVGKTQLALNFGVALAQGNDFLGIKNEAGAVKVLFLSLEMAHPSLDEFIRPIFSTIEDMRTFSKNFFVAPLGTDLAMNKAEGQKFLGNILSEFRPDVVIVDSLQKSTSESLSDELKTRELMSALDKLRVKYQCAMMFIHHDRKKAQQKSLDPGSLSDMYGSQYIGANADYVLSLQENPEMPGQLILADWKNRLAAMRYVPLDVQRNKDLTFELATGPSIAVTEDDQGKKGVLFV